MSTIIEKLDRLNEYKLGMKDAIINKGQSAGDNMSTYAHAIRAIVSNESNLDKLLKRTLTEYTFPSGLTSVSGYGFKGLTSLQKIDLNDVATMGTSYSLGEFRGCTGLSEVIGGKLTSVPQSGFRECTSLESIGLPRCHTLYDYAFMDSNNLRYVQMACPEDPIQSPKGIYSYSFGHCSNLQYVDFYKSTEVISLGNVNAFSGTSCAIIVPDELYDEWITATNWAAISFNIVKNSDTTQWGDLDSYRAKYV